MKEYDYRAALEHCKEPDLVADQTRAFIDVIHLTTIRHALRFAEKMMAIPTQEMVDAALYTQDIYTGRGSLARMGFEAMRDAALKELGE